MTQIMSLSCLGDMYKNNERNAKNREKKKERKANRQKDGQKMERKKKAIYRQPDSQGQNGEWVER